MRNFGGELLCLRDGAFHAFRSFCEDHTRTEDLEHLATFDGHRFRHREDQLNPFRGGDECKRDTGIARGRLDEDGVLRNFTGANPVFDHRVADAVLDGRKRIEKLKLQEDFCLRSVRGSRAIEAHEGGVADRFSDVVVDFSHDGEG